MGHTALVGPGRGADRQDSFALAAGKGQHLGQGSLAERNQFAFQVQGGQGKRRPARRKHRRQ